MLRSCTARVSLVRVSDKETLNPCNIGVPLAMNFSMAHGPPTSHKENYIHSWLQDTVEAHQLLLDKIVCFAMSNFGGTHAASRLMIAMGSFSAPPLDTCRPYSVAAYITARTTVFRVLGDSQDVQTLGQQKLCYVPAFPPRGLWGA
jgi:hypothetical protein